MLCRAAINGIHDVLQLVQLARAVVGQAAVAAVAALQLAAPLLQVRLELLLQLLELPQLGLACKVDCECTAQVS